MDELTLRYYAQNAADLAVRYESIVSGLANHFGAAFKPGSRVLDIGCGSGRDLAFLASTDCDVYGVDATEALVALSQELHPELCGRVILGALPDLGQPFGGKFDGILCSAVLMHLSVTALPPSAESIAGCLVPGGNLLLSVPSRRDDAADAEARDSAGRLFVPDSAGHLRRLFEATGFVTAEEWADTDSLGRSGVEWRSILMRYEPRSIP